MGFLHDSFQSHGSFFDSENGYHGSRMFPSLNYLPEFTICDLDGEISSYDSPESVTPESILLETDSPLIEAVSYTPTPPDSPSERQNSCQDVVREDVDPQAFWQMGLDPETAALVEKLQQTIADFTEMAKGRQPDNFVDTINDAVTSITFVKNSIKTLVVLLTFFYTINRLLRNNSKEHKKLDLVVYGTALWLAHDVYLTAFKKSFEDIASYFRKRKKEEPELQPESQHELFVKVTQLVFNTFSVISVGKAPSAKLMDNAIYKLSNFKRANEGIETSVAWVSDAFKLLVTTARTTLLGEDFSAIIDSIDPAVANWCKEVEECVASSKNKTFAVNRYNAERLDRLALKGRKFMSIEFPEKDFVKLRSAMNAYNEVLKKLGEPFLKKDLVSSGPRTEPFVILVRGGTGMGKSWLSVPFLISMLKQILPASELPDLRRCHDGFIYSRQQEHKYWDGYAGQFVCVWDDFGQVRDVVGQGENEFMDLIRCANLYQHVCHMADIKDKGSTFFNSKLLFLTTNLDDIRCNSLISTEAVERRFDVVIDISIDPRYSEPHSDGKKFKTCLRGFTPMAYSFRCSDGLDDSLPYYTYNFHQLVEHCVKGFKKKESKGLAYLSELYSMSQMDDDLPEDVSLEELEFSTQSLSAEKGWTEKTHLPFEFCDALKQQFLKKEIIFDPSFDYSNVVLLFRSKWPKAEIALQDKGPLYYATVIVSKFGHLDARVFEAYCQPIIDDEFEEGRLTFDDFLNYATKQSSTFCDRHPILSRCLMIMPFIAAGATALYVWRSYSEDDDIAIESDFNGRGKNGAREVARARRTLYKEEQRDSDLHSQGLAEDFIAKIAKKNLYSLVLTCGQEYKIGHVLFVKNRMVLLPRHFLETVESLIEESKVDKPLLQFRHRKSEAKFDITIPRFLNACQTEALDELDLVLLNVPSATLHPNIVESFVEQSFVKGWRDKYTATLVIPNQEELMLPSGEVTKITDKLVKESDAHGASWIIKRGWKYEFPTKRGDCGSVLISNENCGGNRVILGLHVAGHNHGRGMGVSAVVTLAELKEVVKKLEDTLHPVLKPEAIGSAPFKTRRQLVSPVPRNFVTCLRESPLYGSWKEPTTCPTRLRPFINKEGKEIDPMANALAKYVPKYFIDCDGVIDNAMGYFFSNLHSNVAQESSFPVFTFEMAILGDPTLEYVNSIPRGTSAGYPYIMSPKTGYSGKQWFFGKGQDYDLTRPQCVELKKYCLSIISKAIKNERVEHVYSDNLKDERRPFAKVELGKTRLFSAAPLPLLIVTRMYFLSFSSFLMQNCVESGLTLGINPYGLQWSQLASKLQEKGLDVAAGDYTNFDGSHSHCMLSLLGKHVIDFIGGSQEDKNVRNVLWQELTNSVHVNDTDVYEWVGGLPSGHPLTSVVNSLIALVLYRVAWDVLSPSCFRASDYDFYISAVSFGDDSVVNIAASVVCWYNQNTIALALTQFGYVYTNEMKDGVVPDSRRLYEVTFLKRGFVYDPKYMRFLAPLELDVILEMPFWYKKGGNPKSMTATNLDTALWELSLHGPVVFDKWAPLFISASKRKISHLPANTSYSQNLKLTFEILEYW